MSVNISLPVLFSSMPHLSNVAQAAQDHPEIMQAYSQEAAQEAALKDRDQVQTAEMSEESPQVAKDGGGNSPDGERRGRRRRQRQEEEREDLPGESASPWTGNIVNVKI